MALFIAMASAAFIPDMLVSVGCLIKLGEKSRGENGKTVNRNSVIKIVVSNSPLYHTSKRPFLSASVARC